MTAYFIQHKQTASVPSVQDKKGIINWIYFSSYDDYT